MGSDIAPVYSGIADGSAVTGMPYVAMDITNEQQVRQVMDQVRPDAVIHCAAWTAVDLARGRRQAAQRYGPSTWTAPLIWRRRARPRTAR